MYGRKGKSQQIPKDYDQSTVLTIAFETVILGSGKFTDRGFYLLEGSRIMATYEGQNNPGIKKIIENLSNDNLLLNDYPYYILKSDILLYSPSTAARLVHGNSRNGFTSWKKDGKTLANLLV